MGPQRQRSSHVLGPRWFLLSILMVTVLTVPAVSLDSLLCYYCPLQYKGKSCPNITSQCLPDQRCSSSRGYYGSIHIVSAQGCVNRELCASHEILSHRGVKYNISHDCCCEDTCNFPPKSKTNLKKLLGIIKADYSKVTVGVSQEQPFDSCANYTSSKPSTLSATAS